MSDRNLRAEVEAAKARAATISGWPETGCREPYEDGFEKGALESPLLAYCLERLALIDELSNVRHSGIESGRIARDCIAQIKEAQVTK